MPAANKKGCTAGVHHRSLPAAHAFQSCNSLKDCTKHKSGLHSETRSETVQTVRQAKKGTAQRSTILAGLLITSSAGAMLRRQIGRRRYSGREHQEEASGKA